MAPEIRRVTLELLRRGPRHNQLLSPLTDYLAVCGDFPGGVVNVPYEQADVLNLLDELRYQVSSDDASDRLSITRDRAGADIALMLANVPGLPGVISGERPDVGSFTHLRIVMSAAELALLPFEMSKVPIGAGSISESWLALQPDRPLCVTRHVRGVARTPGWVTKPKILFISGDDVPFEQHFDALERALAPWRLDVMRPAAEGKRHLTSEHLTVLERATLEEIDDLTSTNTFTHVHVLAHGAVIEHLNTARYGISIGDRVVTGNELALALASTSNGQRVLPRVVTLASCDSAAQGSVVTPGGSVAHDLHAAGIPLVVASQFPISEGASIPFVEEFYGGQLAGENPLITMCEVRRLLATQFPDEHAWASIVVYEALPSDFDARLEDLHYWQTRRAHEAALKRLERLVDDDQDPTTGVTHAIVTDAGFASPSTEVHAKCLAAVGAAADRLPREGPYAAECSGLRAAGCKRMAEVAYWLSIAADCTPERSDELFSTCVTHLEDALDGYQASVRWMLTSVDEPVHRMASIHWMVGQVMLLQAILGREPDPNLAGIARLTMLQDLDHSKPSVRAWATVSMIEQSILELAIAGPTPRAVERAIEHANELVRSVGNESEQVLTTGRQMRRFTTWWGDARFDVSMRAYGIDRPVAWDQPGGVVPTAQSVADVLGPRRSPQRLNTRSDEPADHPRRAAPSEPGDVPGDLLAKAPKKPAEGDAASTARTGSFDIEMLPANNGDCLWITYGARKKRQLLIDCGSVSAAGTTGERVKSVSAVELFILTHIDADHISGAIPLFTDTEVAGRFSDVWFNGWDQLRGFLSVAQGEAFSDILDRDDRPFLWNQRERADDPTPPILTDGLQHPEVQLEGGMTLTVLSPTRSGLQRLAAHWRSALKELDPQKAMLGRRARPRPPEDPAALDLVALAKSGPTKDTSIPNLSSIVVLAEYGGRAVLLTGDAHADVLATSIKSLQKSRGLDGQRLRLDAMKLSHHGSANATTRELLETVDCAKYLVPTDGSIFYHPDRQAIARVIVHGGPNPVLHFNYRTDLNEFWENAELQAKYNYSTVYPPGDPGLTITL